MPSSFPLKQLRGRVAVITGASRGIGREIALALAKAGCKVVVAAKSVKEKPNLPGTIYTVAEEVRQYGSDALPFQCDVRNPANIHRMIQKAYETYGRIDFLICNSGALWWKDVESTPMTRYDLVHEVNVRATFCCVHEVLPIMKRQGYGRIIVMSPPVDLGWLQSKVAYGISKYGMTMIAMGVAKEVAGTGISINALWPATMIESYATKNFKMAARSHWRKATIVADCVVKMVQEPPEVLNGEAIIDEDYLRSRGVTDFKKYRCVEQIEPMKVWPPTDDVILHEAKDAKGVPPGISARL
ncbi:3-oxoacyl-acyl carrier-protein reductase [Gracilaria domingensis]|nr:3-oxoacyl-acyl carrier-protein reductase [Gracilaria domingensis]